MALATTCPQCGTSFRVVPDQLKLRRGFVRCGRCHDVFAGIDHLRYVDDAQLRKTSGVDAQPRTAAATEAEPGFDVDAEAVRDSHDALVAGYRDVRRDRATNEAEWIDVGPGTLETFADGAVTDETVTDETVTGEALAGEALADEALADEALADEARGNEAPVDAIVEDDVPADAHLANEVAADASAQDDALVDASREDEAPADARRTAELPAETPPFDEALPDGADAGEILPEAAHEDAPPPYVERYTGSTHEDDGTDAESAIDYFSTRRARGFADRRGLATAALAIALAIALALQWVVAERSTIAARVPGVEPLLGAALAPFGLHIEAPSELDALTIESFELQASAAPDVLELRALLRNRADHPVRWPSMQLTLTDPESRVLVRRALHPDDYLAEAGAARAAGVPAHTEWPLRLALEATDLQAAGYDYRVQLFYP